MKKNFQHFFHLEISFNDTNFKNWCTSSRVPAGYKDLCAFFIQNDQLQTAFALWIEYLYLLGLIIILLGDKHTTLHMSVVRARPLNMLSQKLFQAHFNYTMAEWKVPNHQVNQNVYLTNSNVSNRKKCVKRSINWRHKIWKYIDMTEGHVKIGPVLNY